MFVVKVMTETNKKLEDERQMMLMQLQTLMNQLQQLLTELINSKDTYANEQKHYLSVAAVDSIDIVIIIIIICAR